MMMMMRSCRHFGAQAWPLHATSPVQQVFCTNLIVELMITWG